MAESKTTLLEKLMADIEQDQQEADANRQSSIDRLLDDASIFEAEWGDWGPCRPEQPVQMPPTTNIDSYDASSGWSDDDPGRRSSLAKPLPTPTVKKTCCAHTKPKPMPSALP